MEMLEISERTIRRHLKVGILKGTKVSGKWEFTSEDIENYLTHSVTSSVMKQKSVRDFFEFTKGIGEKADLILVSKNINIAQSDMKEFSKKVGDIKGPSKFEMYMKNGQTNVLFYGTEEGVIEFLELIK
jgi:hypothetical protein